MSTPQRSILRYILGAYISFIGLISICALLRPDVFDHPDYGISFFGSIRLTLAPYIIGFVVTIYCLWAIARELRGYSLAKPLRWAFLASAALMLGILLTPMALHPVIWWTHMGIGALLGLSQLAVSTWILLQKGAGLIDYLLGLIYLFGAVVVIFSGTGTWPGLLDLLFTGQVIVFHASLLLMGRAALRTVNQ